MTEHWTVTEYHAYLRGAAARGRLRQAETVLPPPSLTHKAFQAAIVRLATAHGWKAHFTTNSRKSPSGWPDLVLARVGECLIAEMKVGTDTVSIEQAVWLQLLGTVPGLETYVWHGPDAWPQIEQRLTQPKRNTEC